MHIGIDVREAARQTGKGIYTRCLVQELLENFPHHTYILYTQTPIHAFQKYKHAHIKTVPYKGIVWHIAALRDWQKRAKNETDAVFFAPTSFIIPALLSKKYRSIITIHDLIAFKEKTHQRRAVILERIFAGRAIAKTHSILVPSQNTSNDLHHFFPKSQGKIVVTPLGVDNVFFAVSKRQKRLTGDDVGDKAESVFQRFRTVLPEKYILTVSGLEPRKNVKVLIDAFLELPEKYNDYYLLIIGGMGWKNRDVHKKILLHKRIQHITDVTRQELPTYYRNARIFVFPSLYEGFGLPPLEAMASGIPVICSNAASLPEVCGDAALLFDPKNSKKLKDTMSTLLRDKNLQKKLITMGNARAQMFTWNHCAEIMHRVINNLAP